ncbi:cobalamin biosynthesis protein [Marinomonas pontica]|uniref:cobalamin biosynthesis protein n=1 Tax=Marinomonas pontica TaxID=264739 RepID=UPI002ADD8C20|nr:cobalamin biosynthesis protein [Marinomonas pontica]
MHSLNSIDIKADETNLIALADKYHWDFNTYSAQDLAPMESLLSTKSDYIFNPSASTALRNLPRC